MSLSQHIAILRQAADNQLPELLDAESGIDLGIVKELIDSGYLTAINVSTLNAAGFLESKITMLGREYLEANDRKVREGSWLRKAAIWGLNNIWKIIIAVVSAVFVAYLKALF